MENGNRGTFSAARRVIACLAVFALTFTMSGVPALADGGTGPSVDAPTPSNPPESVEPSAAPIITPAAVGDTFTATINVGGQDIPCVYRVLSDNGNGTGTVQVGTGTDFADSSPRTAISTTATGDLIIPETVENNGVVYTVTTLGGGCFMDCTGITSTGLASNTSVTALWAQCFQNTGITSTGLGSNSTVKTLGEGKAFANCQALADTGLATNATVTDIPDETFEWDNALVDTGLGSNTTVETLGRAAFSSCGGLRTTGLATNEKITRIGPIAFFGCTSLSDTGMATNDTVTEIDAGAFMLDNDLVNAAFGSRIVSSDAGAETFPYIFFMGPLESVCYYGDYFQVCGNDLTGAAIGSPARPIIYRLSENTTWSGKTAADVAADAAAVKSLSHVEIVGGRTSSAPSNHWATIAGSESAGRWADGETMQLHADLPVGSHFVRWTTTDATGTFSSETDPEAVYTVGVCDGAETATVTALYEPNTYKVAFVGNALDATGAMADEAMVYGATAPLTANSFVRSGYTFAGWNTAADGSGTAYADGASVKNLAAADGATVTLYAQWKATPLAPVAPATGTHDAVSVMPQTSDPAPLGLLVLAAGMGLAIMMVSAATARKCRRRG